MKKLIGLIFISLMLVNFCPKVSYSQTASVPINITVNGTLTVSDSINDSNAGKNPTINVNLSVIPDLGAAEVVGEANFRLRTNRSTWRLTAQRTQETDSGPTNITAKDVGLLITTLAGSNANSMAGTIVSPFNAKTDLSSVSTSQPVDVVNGTSKTSTTRDNGNANNYFQINTKYSVLPDFFYQPGTWSTTVTYNFVSP